MRARCGLNDYLYLMATIKFILQSKSETTGIYVRLKEGRLIDIKAKTNFLINANSWSSSKGQPKNLKDAEVKKLWAKLIKFQSELLNHYNSCQNKLDINTQWLKDFINPPEKNTDVTNRLVEYFDFYLLHKKNDLSLASYKKLNVIKQLVLRFQTSTKSKYLVKDVDNNFKLRFENYCKTEQYAPNTIARTINFIKTICYHARANGIETNFQLDSISTKYHKADKVYLEPNELKKIEKVELREDNLINAKDWLLISCETGQRVSDFLNFKKDQIRYEEGKPLIEFTQVKTGKIMTVPLSKKVLDILKKRKGEFPKSMSDQKYNDFIKEVCRKAGLTNKVKGSIVVPNYKNEKRKKVGTFEKWELITSHVGRRSFATNNYGKIPTSLLIGATGHSTEKMFLEYIGKSDTQKALQLAEYF
jgi:integrase